MYRDTCHCAGKLPCQESLPLITMPKKSPYLLITLIFLTRVIQNSAHKQVTVMQKIRSQKEIKSKSIQIKSIQALRFLSGLLAIYSS